MRWFTRLFGRPETRSAPTTWDLLRTGGTWDTDSGVPVNSYAAENLSVVFACVQIISETVGMLPLHVYRKLGDGSRIEESNHPVARVFGGDANERQTACE